MAFRSNPKQAVQKNLFVAILKTIQKHFTKSDILENS